ncbi:MAG: biotin carboxylase N-terminal domain-containing protein, partial [Dehalococcoidia bacterium]
MRKLMIANRGEIAVRIIRAAREMRITPVAVYSQADRRALHVQLAAEAYCIGRAPAVESYLNQAAILEAARTAGADAIHPGYGFLAENAPFAEACVAAGLLYVGPPPEAIRLMGDKREAKRLMRQTGIPVVPGYDGDEQSDERLEFEAAKIGYPLLIKAAAGGGGKGMRIVERVENFLEELAGARREARSAFGDERVLLERLLRGARHVEIQVLADHHGTTLALGERECSIQRRHQKAIEETPSTAVNADLRGRMSRLAIRVADAVGYRNAGTV